MYKVTVEKTETRGVVRDVYRLKHRNGIWLGDAPGIMELEILLGHFGIDMGMLQEEKQGK